MPLIAPSILTADFAQLGDAVRMLNASQADFIHCDVMDGHFVPNISFGLPVLASVKALAVKPLDVHLMITEPERYLQAFKEAGADVLTVHYEASIHLHRTLQAIHQLGMRAGIALNPSTPVEVLSEIITEADLICVMAVNPGFGGQRFIPNTFSKVKRLAALIREKGSSALIEIDGGVSLTNAADLVLAGADVLVAGNAVFSSADPQAVISELKAARPVGSLA